MADFDGLRARRSPAPRCRCRAVPRRSGSRGAWRRSGASAATGDPLDVPDVSASTRRRRSLDLAGGVPPVITTSMGRLFDAVAVLLGGRTTRQLRGPGRDRAGSRWRGRSHRADAARLRRTRDDRAHRRHGRARSRAARGAPRRRRASAARRSPCSRPRSTRRSGAPRPTVAVDIARRRGIDAVVLTGGVFQNVSPHRDRRSASSSAPGCRVLVHERIPPNDGGLSIGQAAIAAH